MSDTCPNCKRDDCQYHHSPVNSDERSGAAMECDAVAHLNRDAKAEARVEKITGPTWCEACLWQGDASEVVDDAIKSCPSCGSAMTLTEGWSPMHVGFIVDDSDPMPRDISIIDDDDNPIAGMECDGDVALALARMMAAAPRMQARLTEARSLLDRFGRNVAHPAEARALLSRWEKEDGNG